MLSLSLSLSHTGGWHGCSHMGSRFIPNCIQSLAQHPCLCGSCSDVCRDADMHLPTLANSLLPFPPLAAWQDGQLGREVYNFVRVYNCNSVYVLLCLLCTFALLYCLCPFCSLSCPAALIHLLLLLLPPQSSLPRAE